MRQFSFVGAFKRSLLNVVFFLIFLGRLQLLHLLWYEKLLSSMAS